MKDTVHSEEVKRADFRGCDAPRGPSAALEGSGSRKPQRIEGQPTRTHLGAAVSESSECHVKRECSLARHFRSRDGGGHTRLIRRRAFTCVGELECEALPHKNVSRVTRAGQVERAGAKRNKRQSERRRWNAAPQHTGYHTSVEAT